MTIIIVLVAAVFLYMLGEILAVLRRIERILKEES
jgi:hypothetical protein